MPKWKEGHNLNNATETVYFGHKLFRNQSFHHFRSSSSRAPIPGIGNSQECFVAMPSIEFMIHEKSSGAGLQACSINLQSSFPTAARAILLKYRFDHDVNRARASLGAQLVKNLPAMQETPVRFLGWGEPLETG